MRIAIPLYDRFTALDAVGPYEVLSRLPGASVTWLAHEPGPVATDTGQHFWDAGLHHLKGELLLATDPASSAEAEALFRSALDIARAQEAKSFELGAATSHNGKVTSRAKRVAGMSGLPRVCDDYSRNRRRRGTRLSGARRSAPRVEEHPAVSACARSATPRCRRRWACCRARAGR